MYAITLATLLLVSCSPAQNNPEERKQVLPFRLKDAPVDAVLQFVSSETGWIFVLETAVTGKVNAYSEQEIPVSDILPYLDSVLRYHRVTTHNPHYPDLPKPGQIVIIVDTIDGPLR